MKKMGLVVLALAMLGSLAVWAGDPMKSKESYLKKADGEVQEWSAALKSLQEKSEKSGAETRQEVDHRIKQVDEKLAVAKKKLEDLRLSSESNWQTMRRGLDQALRDVKRAMRNAQSLFNSKPTKGASL